MGILSDTYDEIKTLPPAGKVIAVGAVAGVGLIALHAFRSGQSGSSGGSSGGSSSGGFGPATGANLTTSQGTDPWGDKWWIPSSGPGQPTTTSPTPTPTPTPTPAPAPDPLAVWRTAHPQWNTTTNGAARYTQEGLPAYGPDLRTYVQVGSNGTPNTLPGIASTSGVSLAKLGSLNQSFGYNQQLAAGTYVRTGGTAPWEYAH